MKAAVALLVLYVAAFFVVVSSSPQSAPAEKQDASPAQSAPISIDPAKEADIRSLMELMGSKEMLNDAANAAAEQYREKILSSMPDNDKAQTFVNSFVDNFKARYNSDEIANQLVAAYDKHFTADEIKGLLQFYGSPLGQKTAEEMPKLTREIQAGSRELSARVAKEVLQELKAQYPMLGQSARLNGNGNANGYGRRRQQWRQQQQQSPAQPPTPQQP